MSDLGPPVLITGRWEAAGALQSRSASACKEKRILQPLILHKPRGWGAWGAAGTPGTDPFAAARAR